MSQNIPPEKQHLRTKTHLFGTHSRLCCGVLNTKSVITRQVIFRFVAGEASMSPRATQKQFEHTYQNTTSGWTRDRSLDMLFVMFPTDWLSLSIDVICSCFSQPSVSLAWSEQHTGARHANAATHELNLTFQVGVGVQTGTWQIFVQDSTQRIWPQQREQKTPCSPKTQEPSDDAADEPRCVLLAQNYFQFSQQRNVGTVLKNKAKVKNKMCTGQFGWTSCVLRFVELVSQGASGNRHF